MFLRRTSKFLKDICPKTVNGYKRTESLIAQRSNITIQQENATNIFGTETYRGTSLIDFPIKIVVKNKYKIEIIFIRT